MTTLEKLPRQRPDKTQNAQAAVWKAAAEVGSMKGFDIIVG